MCAHSSGGQTTPYRVREQNTEKNKSAERESEDQSNFIRHYVTSEDRSFCINLLAYASHYWVKALDLKQ